MAYPSVTYTFVNGPTQIIDADAVNTNFSDIINALKDGTKTLNVSNVTAATLTITNATSNLIPSVTNTYTLGSASLFWNIAYITTINAYSATIATGLNVTGKVTSDLLPVTNNTRALGSGALHWNALYVKDIIATGSLTLTGALQASGQITIIDGSAATPAIGFSSSSNTGIYTTGSNDISFTSAGSNILTLGATGIFANPIRVPAGSTVTPAIQIGGTSAGLSYSSGIQFSTSVGLVGKVADTGLWTLGDSGGTSTHVINGGFATTKGCSIGGTANAFTGLAFNGTGLGLTGTGQIGISMLYSFDAAVATGAYTAFFAQPISRSTTGTCAAVRYFYAKTATKGATDTWTRHTIFLTDAPVAGANNCVLSDNESYSGNWYINQSGTTNSQFGGLVGHKQATDNVTDAGPTQAEMVTALGAANQLNAGIGAIKDANADTNFFLCMTNGTSWYYVKLTKGA